MVSAVMRDVVAVRAARHDKLTFARSFDFQRFHFVLLPGSTGCCVSARRPDHVIRVIYP
jgi:hypothetical protein